MRIRLVGPDDIIPGGVITVSTHTVPRLGEMIVVDTHPSLIGVRFRVTDVCWYANTDTRWDVEVQIPDVAVEAEE